MSQRPTPRPAVRTIGVMVVLALAAVLTWRAMRAGGPPGEKGFFYDVSAGKIFVGPRTAAPPIRGVDGPDEDGYRAVVISPTGRPGDRASWTVAYLEKFSPELKAKTEAAQASGEALAMGRMEAQAHRWVRRVTDTEWFRMDSPEGEAILSGWARPGPEGVTPVLCTP